jgi:hypothetical protein
MLLASKAAEAFGKPREKTMSYGSKITRCAHCGNPFPVVQGRVQQWRVGGDHFACNEFCAEGVEERAKGQGRS